MNISTFTSALKVLVEDWKKQQEHAQAGFDFPRADAIQECINSLGSLILDHSELLVSAQMGYTLSDVHEAYSRGKAAAQPQPSGNADCVGCEGNPTGNNVPCAVCGSGESSEHYGNAGELVVRAAFEAWSISTNQGYVLTPNHSGKLSTYEDDKTEHAWRGFFHARATLAAQTKIKEENNVRQ